ncbi:flagellar biosynthesis anti-sigma factor FlgM [Thermosipho ferrireducens]|uniref:Negative regulator of flagellin synthesis n=1 Tax=Thermosipho ferrireducens TaxID=2571116 RepID=A0ABX7S8G9_9BACT|nr:flagellar biosynthesis anti-sigma factor FlgM [Thermosipho ferrireducens]QTA38198.1 flagellar biosynthesis anti-sigma factor FlgM [Thermosipho ferrireducens]
MEIKGINGFGQIQGIKRLNAEKIKKGKNDSVEFNESKRIVQLLKAAKEFPEIRTELVQKLKEAIESGTFEINPEKIAEAIVREYK